jgi:hypothetical protein
MLLIWGYFAQRLHLVDQLALVPVSQKVVRHAPAAKLTTLLVGLLSGMEYLSDLSRGPAPLRRDALLAHAWGLPAFAEASGVSRTLAACDPPALTALQRVLDQVAQPFWQQAVQDLRTRQQPLLLDADLTGRPVSDTSQTYPGAAFGYMDGTVRLGYQVAEICRDTALFGRQWLSGHQHPGDTVSGPCLLELVTAAEQRLGCHPRRRPDLVATRLAPLVERHAQWTQQRQECTAQRAALHRRQQQFQRELQAAQRRVTRLRDYPVSPQPRGPLRGPDPSRTPGARLAAAAPSVGDPIHPPHRARAAM